jgi:hypothetical protein
MATIGTPLISSNVAQDTINRVNRLFSTPAGSVPWDRSFGIDMSVLDNPPKAVQGALLVEYIKKLKMYFPTLKINSISFSYSDNGGTIIPKVAITSG